MQNFSTIFVHSLFRAGSTYFYQALKRVGEYHIYHEPFHEVIAQLPSSWSSLIARTDEMKSFLRHGFLADGYFSEYSELLADIELKYDEKFSYGCFFLNAGDNAPELKNYIDMLRSGASKRPVLQCTRTIGRIAWMKYNYDSNHVFLLRNPWTQWYSYKVDSYIANTPRLIYSQCNVPPPLKEVFELSGGRPLIGARLKEQILHGISQPLDSNQDYMLFFGLWLYSFVCGHEYSDVFVDMDAICESEAQRARCVEELDSIGVHGVDFSDVSLHKVIFDERELPRFMGIEADVMQVFKRHGLAIDRACKYLEKMRDSFFLSNKTASIPGSEILEDAYRMRELLFVRDGQVADLSQVVVAHEMQITKLRNSTSPADIREQTVGPMQQVDIVKISLSDKLTELASHLQAQITKRHSAQVNILANSGSASNHDSATLLKKVIESKNETIAAHRAHSAEVEERLQHLHNRLIYAEAQLDILKEMVLGSRLELIGALPIERESHSSLDLQRPSV